MEKRRKEIAATDKDVPNDGNSAGQFGKEEEDLLVLIAQIIVEYILNQEE